MADDPPPTLRQKILGAIGVTVFMAAVLVLVALLLLSYPIDH